MDWIEFEKNLPIKNLDKIKLTDNQYCFHAGTKIIKKPFFEWYTISPNSCILP